MKIYWTTYCGTKRASEINKRQEAEVNSRRNHTRIIKVLRKIW